MSLRSLRLCLLGAESGQNLMRFNANEQSGIVRDFCVIEYKGTPNGIFFAIYIIFCTAVPLLYKFMLQLVRYKSFSLHICTNLVISSN